LQIFYVVKVGYSVKGMSLQSVLYVANNRSILCYQEYCFMKLVTHGQCTSGSTVM